MFGILIRKKGFLPPNPIIMSEGAPKPEANVPAERQKEFKDLAKAGEWQKYSAEEAARRAEMFDNQSKRSKGLAIGTGVAAAAGAVTGAAPFAVANGILSAAFLASSMDGGRKSRQAAAAAPVHADKAVELLDQSRAIVQEGMEARSAERSESGELIATPEQKEAARKEMNERLEERQARERQAEEK